MITIISSKDLPLERIDGVRNGCWKGLSAKCCVKKLIVTNKDNLYNGMLFFKQTSVIIYGATSRVDIAATKQMTGTADMKILKKHGFVKCWKN